MLVSPFLVLVFVPALLGVGDDLLQRSRGRKAKSAVTGQEGDDANSTCGRAGQDVEKDIRHGKWDVFHYCRITPISGPGKALERDS